MGANSLTVRVVNNSFFKGAVLLTFALCTFFLFKDAVFVATDAPKLFSGIPKPWKSKQVSITPKSNDCRDLPGAERVLVVLKTGATAAYERLPIHFETTFRCVPNYMLISDLKDTIGNASLVDVLRLVTPETRKHNDDFKLYHQIQDWHKTGQDMSKLDSQKAWTLDKYKFMPMMQAVNERLDNKTDWVVMMEADTSLSWLNLLLWLKTMNPQEAIFTGSPSYLGPQLFAHGGSGIVMSRAAVEQLAASRMSNGTEGVKDYDQKWEETNKHACCGDAVMAMAFSEAGINMTRSWPLIQGESILTLDWRDENWCAPAITWHHVKGDVVNSMWHFEQKWLQKHGGDTPYLYQDVFRKFVQPHLVAHKKNWDNKAAGMKLSRESEKFPLYEEPDQAAVEDPAACATACKRRRDDCIQWKWKPGQCVMDKFIRLGEADLPQIVDEGDDGSEEKNEDGSVTKTVLQTISWTSGWILDHVEDFIASQEGCNIRWSGRPLGSSM